MSSYRIEPTNDPIETHILVEESAHGVSRVGIAPMRGALVTRFDDLLFMDESTLRDTSKNVRGGIPILFPFAGKLTDGAFVVDGKRFAMGQHGFGRNLPWTVVSTSTTDAATLVLALNDNEATRAMYPFAFAATLTLTLRERALTLELSVKNVGANALPIAPGWHPYFLVADVDKPQTRVITDATHARDNRNGQAVTLDGPINLVADEVDLHLTDHHAARASLVRPNAKTIALEFTPGVLVVWTLRGRDFVCLEPWAAPADAFNSGAAWLVEPGATRAFAATIFAHA